MCGYAEEHVHTPDCYDGDALACGLAEHIHTDACYQEWPDSADDMNIQLADAPVVDPDMEDVDLSLSLSEDDFTLVSDDVAPAQVASNDAGRQPKAFILGEGAMVSQIIDTLGLGVGLDGIIEAAVVENDPAQVNVIGIEKIGSDYRIWALQDFARAQLALVVEGDILLVDLLDGVAVREDTEDETAAEAEPAREDIRPVVEDSPVDEAAEGQIEAVPAPEAGAEVAGEQPDMDGQTEVGILLEDEAPVEAEALVEDADAPVGDGQGEEAPAPSRDAEPADIEAAEPDAQAEEEAEPAEDVETVEEEAAPVEDEETAEEEAESAEGEEAVKEEAEPAEDGDTAEEEATPAEGEETTEEEPTEVEEQPAEDETEIDGDPVDMEEAVEAPDESDESSESGEAPAGEPADGGQAACVATFDLAGVSDYPLSLNALLAEAAPVADGEAGAIPGAEEAGEEAPAEAPVIEYDHELLDIEASGDDHLITPVASFESTVITVDNGSRYALTLVNFALPEVEDAAEAEPLPEYPAQDFECHTRYVKVVVSAPEGAFPAGTMMAVADVEDEKTLTDIEDTVSEAFVEVKRVHAVDITFTDAEGNEIEPLAPISVVMTVDEIEQQQEAVVVHVDDDGATEVVQSQSEAPEGETGVKVEMPAGEAPAGDESAVGFEADSFSVYAVVITETIDTKYIDAEGATWNISVGYGPEAGIPEGARLAVQEVEGDYLEQTAELLKGRETITLARFFDITILDAEGNEVQPARPVEVKAALAEQSEDAVKAVHFAEEGPEILETSQDEDAVSFDAASFSVYGIVYTVDFHFGVDGETYEFTLPGGGAVGMRELAPALGLVEDDEDAVDLFARSIENVAFSDESLVKALPVNISMTVGALKELYELESEYSAELTEAQVAELNDKVLQAPDWALVSLKPFDTEETLTVSLATGETFTVTVTDAQLSQTVITASGEAYVITVTYGEDAVIPDGAELKVWEILPGDEEYANYLAEAKKAASGEASVETNGEGEYARFFDIEIWANDQKVEPAAPVTVDITLADAPLTGEELKVVHFDEADGPVVMQTEAGEEGEDEAVETAKVRFETDGFSVYGVVTYAGGTPAANDLDGRTFIIGRSSRYLTNILTYNPRRLKKGDANDAAEWLFESAGQPGQYFISTIGRDGQAGQKVYLHMEGDGDSTSLWVYPDQPYGEWTRPKMSFTVNKYNNGTYGISWKNGTTTYYVNEMGSESGTTFAGWHQGGNETNYSQMTLTARDQVIQENKHYLVILQKDENYYAVQNDGSLEKVEMIVENGVKKFVVSKPMMWTLEKNSQGNYVLDHKAFVKRTNSNAIPSEWYFRYLTPSGFSDSDDAKPCINTDKVHPALKWDDNTTTYPEDWSYNEQLKLDSAISIDDVNNVIQSMKNGVYLSVNDEGTEMISVGSLQDAAKVFFATTDQLKIENEDTDIRQYNLVNHIDIEVKAKARLTVPLGNAKVYDSNHKEVVISGNRILDLEENVDITVQDLKNASILAYTKDANGARTFIDDAYNITGYSGNASVGITDNQVRVEGRFLVSTYFTDKEPSTAPENNVFLNEDSMQQGDSRLIARYNNRVFYDLSTKKKVTFHYKYKDPKTNEEIDLYDANGNPLMTESIVELTGSFDYWDPNNACPVLHHGFDAANDFIDDWKARRILKEKGWSGMDFTIGADEEGKYKKPGILITKYIYDERNNLIELANETTSQFDVWERPIDGFADANASRNITSTVRDVNRGGEHTKPDDSDLYDTQEKQPSAAYNGFANTHTVTVDVAQSGTGSKYDFSVDSGMIYIQEKNVSPTIVDKNGITWDYVHTIIKTEYVKRAASDTQEDFHYTRVMTDTEKLNSVPDVVGRYFKDDDNTEYSSDSLEFYVYNVYRPRTTSVRVEKSWQYEDGTAFNLTNDDYVDITLGRYKLIDKSGYQWSGDQRKVASVIINQMNYNPDNAVWYKNNYDFRAGDSITIKLCRQKQEVVKYSINGAGYSDTLTPYENGNGTLVWNTIETTIPADGILKIALDDEWGGISGEGRLIVEKNGTAIPSKEDGDKPESPQESPDMEYTLDVKGDGTPNSFGPLRLNNANYWTAEQGGLEAYDENGNAYRYFILREDGSSIGGVIPVIGTTEKGESLTSTGFADDPILTVNNLVPQSSITIKKLDTDGRPLPGAVFSLSVLKKGSWSIVPNADRITVTVPQGESDAQATIPNLFDGRYKLTEIEAPKGYFIRNKDIYFTITNGVAKLTRNDGSGQTGSQEDDIYNNLIEVGNGLFNIKNERNKTIRATKTWGGGSGTAPDGTVITWTIKALNSDDEDVTTSALPTGETAAHTVSAAPWETTWPDLPLAVNGKDVTYTVTETAAKYGTHVYTAEEISEANESVDVSTSGTFAFTNAIPTTEISVRKTWNGLADWLDDQLVVKMTLKGTVPAATEGADPEPVDLSSLLNYTVHDDTTGEDRTVTQNAFVLLQNSKTSHTWHNLPLYDSNGKPITYTVEETGMYYRQSEAESSWPLIANFKQAFTSTTTPNADGTDFTIDNIPKTTEIKVTKVWTQNNAARTDKTDIGYELHKVGADDALIVDAANITVDRGEKEVGKVKYVTGAGWQTVTISRLPRYERVIDTDSETATVTYSPVNYYVTEIGVAGDTRVTYRAGTGTETETASDANTNDGTITIYNRDASVDIKVLKVDATNQTRELKGAEFQLQKYDDASKKYVAYDCTTKEFVTIETGNNSAQATADPSKKLTGDSGELSFTGLPAGQYKLVETQTPAGYIKVNNNDIYFTVTADGALKWTKANGMEIAAETAETDKPNQVAYDSTVKAFTVGNTPGAKLPATGGAGTTPYRVLGSLLALVAVALLVARRRGRA